MPLDHRATAVAKYIPVVKKGAVWCLGSTGIFHAFLRGRVLVANVSDCLFTLLRTVLERKNHVSGGTPSSAEKGLVTRSIH